jgi:hypothetical protein
MANEKVGVDIVVNTGDSDKKLKQTKNQIEDIGDSAKKSEKEAKQASSAFGSLGNAIKSLGIISVIAGAFNFFKEALSKNQKVADAVSAVFNTIATIVNTLVEIFINVTSEVGKSTNGFEALGKVLGGILTLAITPLKLAFDGIKLVISEIQLAWEKSPLGDKDQTTIQELTKSINATKESLATTGKNAVQAGKDIYNNFGEAAKSVVSVVSGVVDKASKINVGAIYEQAKATIALQNSAKIAAAQLQGLVEKYDRQAEQLRQVRDDEFRSIDERIEANNKLAKVLDEQEKAQKKLAQAKVAAAAAELAQNKTNVDLQAALIEAQNEVAGVEAQVAGLRSEQLANAVALTKEKIALDQAVAASENKLLLDRKKANAELIKDEVARLEQKKAIANEEAAIELKRLQDNINNSKAGTQARVDAEIAYAEKKQEIDLSLDSFDQQIQVAKYTREIDNLDRMQTARGVEYEARLAALDAEQVLVEEAFNNKIITEKEYNDKVKSLTDQRIAYQEAEKQAQRDFALATGDVLGQLAGLFEQGTVASKVAGLAQIAISTGVGFAQGLDIAQKSAKATGPAAAFAFPIFYATQIAAVLGAASKAKNILSQVKGGGGGGASASAPSVSTAAPITPAAPIQNTVTQLDQQSINQMGSATNRAYVVESDVTNKQERITRINRAARLS